MRSFHVYARALLSPPRPLLAIIQEAVPRRVPIPLPDRSSRPPTLKPHLHHVACRLVPLGNVVVQP